jgi:hypothetical protein
MASGSLLSQEGDIGINRAWEEVLQSLETARDEWIAMEAVVHLELLLEARNMLIEESRPHASAFGHGQSRAA